MNTIPFARAAQKHGLPFEPLTNGVRIGRVTVTLIPASGLPGVRNVYRVGNIYEMNANDAVQAAIRAARRSTVKLAKPVGMPTHKLTKATPEVVAFSDRALLEMYPPRTVRHCVLHYLATGGGFQRSDVVRHVFGSHLKTGTRGDVQPVFWKQHTDRGLPFDRFAEYVCEEIGLDSWALNARGASDLENEIVTEIGNVLSMQPTSKTAREMLAEEYRKYDAAQLYGEPEPETVIPF